MDALRLVSICLPFCLLALPIAGAAPPPGEFELTGHGNRMALHANHAPLTRILTALQERTEADIRIRSMDEREITGACSPMPIRMLLDWLGVDYLLTYRAADDAGDIALLGAWIGTGRVTGLSHEEARAILRLVSELRDDAVRFNAMRSARKLAQLGEKAVPALEKALEQGDYQTRQFAADILLRYPDYESYVPSQPFLRALVEGMMDDEYPYGVNVQGISHRVYMNNARRGYAYFTRRPDAVDRAEADLVAALAGPDPQQQFLAALILAESGKAAYADELAGLLIPHLQDNKLASDARHAAFALYRLGEASRPGLVRTLHLGDDQAKAFAERVLRGLDDPKFPRRTTGGFLSMGGCRRTSPHTRDLFRR